MKVNLYFDEYPMPNQMYLVGMIEELKKYNDIQLEIVTKKNLNLKANTLLHKFTNKFSQTFSSKHSILSYLEKSLIFPKVDILHLHHSYLFTDIETILFLENRPKIVITLRGGDTYVKPWFYDKWKKFYTQHANLIDAVVVQSEHQAAYLDNFGVDKKLIHVIPSSVKAIKSTKKSLKQGRIKIVSSFRMCWEKNISANIKVIKLLLEQGHDVEYHIYGYGPDLGQVYYLINYYDISEFVIIHGYIENSEYLKSLNDYHFYLQLSILESLSVSVLEAQSHGLPAIVSDSSGIKETIKDGISGYAVPFDNAELAAQQIVFLIANPESYSEFSEQAKVFCNHKFTNKIEAQNYMKLYQQIMTAG